jgi:hypothetical protein
MQKNLIVRNNDSKRIPCNIIRIARDKPKSCPDKAIKAARNLNNYVLLIYKELMVDLGVSEILRAFEFSLLVPRPVIKCARVHSTVLLYFQ